MGFLCTQTRKCVEHNFKRILRLVFRIGNIEAGPTEEEGIDNRFKGFILRKYRAICDAARHRTVEGAAKEFRGGKKPSFQRL